MTAAKFDSRKLRRNIVLDDADGGRHWFGPEDEVPVWAAKLIDAGQPEAWALDGGPVDSDEFIPMPRADLFTPPTPAAAVVPDLHEHIPLRRAEDPPENVIRIEHGVVDGYEPPVSVREEWEQGRTQREAELAARFEVTETSDTAA